MFLLKSAIVLVIARQVQGAVSAADSAELTVLVNDINNNLNDYLGQIQDGNSPPAELLSLYQEVQTYTDDSYTSLYSEVDMAEVSSYITGLPWYSSRLVSELKTATEGASSGGSSAASSAASSGVSVSSTSGGGSSSSGSGSSSTVSSGSGGVVAGGSSGSSGSGSGSSSTSGSSGSAGSSTESGGSSSSSAESSSGAGGSSSNAESSSSGSGSSSSGSGGSSSGSSTASGAGSGGIYYEANSIAYYVVPMVMAFVVPALF